MPNRLAAENSPYLLQHADNPVDWYPWGEPAFERARAEDKPVFLSVGYAACHWCHVMAHESFEDPAVAGYMNEHFINIKVDREQRPDVDAVYMEAVVALTGQGGWPMSVFLTPQGEPFFGGTYFPPTRRYNMPSFMELLVEIQRLWVEERARLFSIGSQLASHLQAGAQGSAGSGELRTGVVQHAIEALAAAADRERGGWGGAPKFPQPAVVELLLGASTRRGGSKVLEPALHALDAMANGGLYDQIGGGFHRYAVDAAWSVPHFEKMLYDNAGLLRAFLHAWQLTGRPRYLEVVSQTFEFLQTELRDPSGGYYASLDADSGGAEGQFYTWTRAQVEAALPDAASAELACTVFGVTQPGNFENTNVLSRRVDLEQLARDRNSTLDQLKLELEALRSTLLAARAARPRPAVDDKILAGWNGLLLVALSEAALATGQAAMLESSQALAGFLVEQMQVDGEFMRTWRHGQASVAGFLEDYAAVGLGLLTLYQVDFDPRWFEHARRLAREIIARFSDADGAFYDTQAEGEQLIVRPRTLQDSPYPSGNTLAVDLLLRLDAIDDDPLLREAAQRTMRAAAEQAADHPYAHAGMLDCIDFELEERSQLALVGEPGSAPFQALLSVAASGFHPHMVRAGGLPDNPGAPALLEARPQQQGLATAYLCRGFQCKLPTSDPQVLAAQLADAIAQGSTG